MTTRSQKKRSCRTTGDFEASVAQNITAENRIAENQNENQKNISGKSE